MTFGNLVEHHHKPLFVSNVEKIRQTNGYENRAKEIRYTAALPWGKR